MGLTGAGKSTIVNATVSGKENMDEDDEGSCIAKEPIIVDGRLMFEIGHKVTSCTETPGYVPLIEGKYLVDAPGLADANALKEYPNQTIIHHLCMSAKSVSILLVLKGADIEANRGKHLIMMLTAISRVLSDNGHMMASNIILPLINKAFSFKSVKIVEVAFQKVIDLLEMKLAAYQSLMRQEEGDQQFDEMQELLD